MDYLEQFLNLQIDGQHVGELLLQACVGHDDVVRLLSRNGITYDGKTLVLNVRNPALGKLLISRLLRETGASMDVDSGRLSIALLYGMEGEEID